MHGPLNTASPSHLHARPHVWDGATPPLQETRGPPTGQRKEQGSFLAGQDRSTAVKSLIQIRLAEYFKADTRSERRIVFRKRDFDRGQKGLTGRT
jgi:hypothetical protein